MALRLAIIGVGRMGRAVRALAVDAGWSVTAEIGRLRGTGDLARADVAIEFTRPDAAVANIRTCVAANCPVVVGTTGWYDQLPAVSAEVTATNGALFWAANFSIGANLLGLLAAQARRALPVDRFPGAIVETHHAAKLDAPSGTALQVARGLEPGAPIASLRVGRVPGTHEVVFDGAWEQLRLEHVVRDRRVFAEGALVAAAWLHGRRGVFTMKDMLEEGS
ncbi:MAG: dihydrodipicolinate reductase C-terminal domain-containing protein [Gemmatimonadota bacterium]